MSDVDSGNLDKRSKPIPFDEHVRLGARLVECLNMNDATARLELQIGKKLGLDEDLQSCYKEYNDLAKHDWEAHRRNGRKIVYDRAFWASERWLEDALATLSPHGAMLGNYEMRYDHPCGKLNPLVRTEVPVLTLAAADCGIGRRRQIPHAGQPFRRHHCSARCHVP